MTFVICIYTFLFSFQVTGQAIRPAMFMTPLQLQMHQQLKAKHAELFRKIIEQQEELRKVSEQLLMTQYGLVPVSAVAPVQLPLPQAPVAVVAQPLTANLTSTISLPGNFSYNLGTLCAPNALKLLKDRGKSLLESWVTTFFLTDSHP